MSPSLSALPRLSSCLAFSRCVALLVVSLLVGTSSFAKEPSLNAIVLFDAEKGAGYVQATDLLVNGKAELRECTVGQRIDKSAYGRLPKVTLAGASSLERTADGLILTKDSNSICVVPPNLKFEKDAGYTPSELADKVVLQGRTAGAPGGDQNLPALKIGVRIVFVTALDFELAEYLLAQRIAAIAGWQDYLAKYANSPHASAARESLAVLLGKDGEDHLATYKQSLAGTTPAFSDLKTAKMRARQCTKQVPNSAACAKLESETSAEVTALNNQAQNELAAYQDALATHKPGYRHLTTAQSLVGHVLDMDPLLESGQTSDKQISAEAQKFENTLQNTDTLIKAQRIDEAYTAVNPYLAFAEEDTRVSNVIRAAYSYHLDRSHKAQTEGNWQEAVQEAQRALQISHTKEAEGALEQAQTGLQTFQDRSAADKALAQSQEFEEQKQIIDAYETLANLPEGAKALVVEPMQQLQPAYVKAASQKALDLQKAHTPIKGKVDELNVQLAYDYLERASTLDEDDKNLKLRLDLLGETISDYYFQQGRKYLEKPLGSGVGLAWLYFDLAQQYKPSREDVKDERVKSSALYQMRSKLSIRVVFRDQTSRRDSPQFAEQLSDAIATGLETSGLPVKVIRSTDTPSAEANFQLIGDVFQHRTVVNTAVDSRRSKYRVGVREVTNENWTKANREDEELMQQEQNAQRAMDAAQARGKEKEIADAAAVVAAAHKKVQESHQRLDAIQKTIPVDVIEEYSYTKKTIDLDATVELAFRLVDANGNVLDSPPHIQRTTHKTFTVLDNVKPEDTEGIKEEGTPPNELQYLTDIEIEGRDTLIKAVKEKVEGLPRKLFEQAKKKAGEEDLDGAAESYILFLNSSSDTNPVQKPQRDEAKRFLLEQFNIRDANLSAS